MPGGLLAEVGVCYRRMCQTEHQTDIEQNNVSSREWILRYARSALRQQRDKQQASGTRLGCVLSFLEARRFSDPPDPVRGDVR